MKATITTDANKFRVVSVEFMDGWLQYRTKVGEQPVVIPAHRVQQVRYEGHDG